MRRHLNLRVWSVNPTRTHIGALSYKYPYDPYGFLSRLYPSVQVVGFLRPVRFKLYIPVSTIRVFVQAVALATGRTGRVGFLRQTRSPTGISGGPVRILPKDLRDTARRTVVLRYSMCTDLSYEIREYRCFHFTIQKIWCKSVFTDLPYKIREYRCFSFYHTKDMV